MNASRSFSPSCPSPAAANVASTPHTSRRLRGGAVAGALLAWAWVAALDPIHGAPASSPLLIPAGREIVARVRKEHPRLLLVGEDWTRLKTNVQTHPTLRGWREALETRAQRLLEAPPSRYEIPDGLRLLSTSRRVLDRVYTLGLLYRLGADPRYRDRAWRELEAAAQFKDWNPRHFLDTAEMTHAFAIAYDWLYDDWTAGQRQTLRQALVDKGLKPALASYQGGSYGWWARSKHNWNQVCNGGIGMGALALADAEPELAGDLLHRACVSLQTAMAEFAPDGAWAEGPGYWDYATAYNVVFLAGLGTALGTDFGLSGLPAFGDTGLFPIHLTGPLGRTFNYADGGDHTIRAPQMFWLARRFRQPAYAQYELEAASPEAQDLIWMDPGEPPAVPPPALDRHFRGAEVVLMRSQWRDRDALFAGFKGGDNQANHSHLDLGTFVLDALGTRWAVDLGADDYNLPAYFGNKRWTYYRLRAEAHNTLVLNPGPGPDQDPRAAAPVTRFKSEAQSAFAIADLTAAYARHARRVERGLALLGRREFLVQDEVEAAEPLEAWWFLHTPAEVELAPGGASATLTQGNRHLLARLLAPAGAQLTVLDAQPLPDSPHPEKQAANQGIRKLAVQLKDVRQFRLAVLLTPLREGGLPAAAPPPVRPLAQW